MRRFDWVATPGRVVVPVKSRLCKKLLVSAVALATVQIYSDDVAHAQIAANEADFHNVRSGDDPHKTIELDGSITFSGKDGGADLDTSVGGTNPTITLITNGSVVLQGSYDPSDPDSPGHNNANSGRLISGSGDSSNPDWLTLRTTGDTLTIKDFGIAGKTGGTTSADESGIGGAIYFAKAIDAQGLANVVFENNKAISGQPTENVVSYGGLGGAIYTTEFDLSGARNLIFRGNLAQGADSSDDGLLNARTSGSGGAIYAATTDNHNEFAFREADSVQFTNNTARAGIANGNVREWSAYGGAIFAGGKLDLSKSSNFLFRENQALGGDSIAGGNGSVSGHGGAIHAHGAGEAYPLDMSGVQDFLFDRNLANGGDVRSGGDGTQSGWGGAIWVNDTFVMDNAQRVTFSGNEAHGGSAEGQGSNASQSGQGAAIWVTDQIYIRGASDLLFEKNVAIGGNAIGGDSIGGATTSNSGHGGALHTWYDVDLSRTNAVSFVENEARGGSARQNGIASDSGRGGAISSLGSYETRMNISQTTGMTFDKNKAIAGEADAGNTQKSGIGGAIYTNAHLDLSNSSQMMFHANEALGGNAKNNGNAGDSGRGGAVHVSWNSFSLAGAKDIVFSGNKAIGGNAETGGRTVGSGWGGALYAYNVAVDLTGAENVVFEGNLAQGGDADSNSLVYHSGFGGAIYAAYAQDYSGATSLRFHANRAVGGLAGADRFNGSGLGGAIYSLGDLTLSGASFTDNSASTRNGGDQSSGRGGAIFMDAGNNSTNLRLYADANAPMWFAGNVHNPGNAGETPNSIYFGTTSLNGSGSTVTEINAGSGGTVFMLDPMASQADGLGGPNGWIYGNVVADVAKSGAGMWVLAGHNDMRSASHWSLNDGGLHLVPTPSRSGAYERTYIDLSHANSSFISEAGSKIWVTPAGTDHWKDNPNSDIWHKISGSEIRLKQGTDVGLTGYQYGPVIRTGTYTVLELDGRNSIENLSDPTQTAGSITVGAYVYEYENLHWEGGDREYLVVDLTGSQLDPDKGGAPVLMAAIVTMRPADRVIFNHMNTRFADLADGGCGSRHNSADAERAMRRAAMGDSAPAGRFGATIADAEDFDSFSCLSSTAIWVTPNATFMHRSRSGQQAGFDLTMPSVTIGLDHFVSDDVFVGVAGTLANGNYRSHNTRLNVDSFGVAVYGGVRLPAGFELSLAGEYTRQSSDYRRTPSNIEYYGDFDADMLRVGFELGRPFKVGEGVTLRPWGSYEYLHTWVGSIAEQGQSGPEAVRFKERSEGLHRLWFGAALTQEITESGSLTAEAYYLGFFGDTVTRATGVFMNDPDQNEFQSYATALDRHMGGFGVRFDLDLDDQWAFTAGYDVKLGSESVIHHGALTLRYAW